MKIWIIILICLVGILCFVYLFRQILKGLKSATAPTVDDRVYELRWKIENAVVTEENELYFRRQIKDLNNDPYVDKVKVNELDIMFRQRYQDLHQTT